MARAPWRSALALAGLLATVGACAGPPRAPEAPARQAAGNGSATEKGHDAGRGPGAGFTLLATGDLIPYPSIIEQARADAGGTGYDFRPILAGVRPQVAAADLALCHLETPFSPEDGPFTGYPLFRSPPQLAEALAHTGYDSCSTASNHSLDAGFAGASRTLDALDAAGVRHAGSARTAREAGEPTLLRAAGARVAHLAYTYGTNGIPAPEGKPWAVNPLDADRVIADARAARRAGADVVVVSAHWGTEWQQAPDAQQQRLARVLTASRSGGERDIDLVIGTHNHVPQPYEKINGTWVVHGLGDQMASFVPSMRRGNEGSMARFTFVPRADGERWRVGRAEFLVGHSDTGPPFRVVRATEEDRPEVHARVREAVLSRGAAGDGLREGR